MKTLLLTTVLLLGACATTSTDISRAKAYCANNGGVTQVKAKYTSTVHVTCGNSAVFKFISNGSTK